MHEYEITFNVRLKKYYKGGKRYLDNSKGTIFKETNGKEELIGPRDFITCIKRAYQSFYHFTVSIRYDKISVNNGHRRRVNIRFRPFPFVHPWFFICSPSKRNFTIVIKSFCKFHCEIFITRNIHPYFEAVYNYFP